MDQNKPITHKALTKEIADRLCARVREGRFAPGTVIGTEAELAQEFGVSRTVIREAIGQLRGLGLVRSRQGLGVCVASVDLIDTMARTLAPVLGDESKWSDLCHLRFILEVGSLPLAVERATGVQIEQLRRLAQEMHALIQSGRPITREVEEKVAQLEIEFHELIFKATGCEFAGQFHGILVEYFHESTCDRPHSSLPNVGDMEEHLRLVEAIAERNVSKAVEIMVAHVQDILPRPQIETKEGLVS